MIVVQHDVIQAADEATVHVHLVNEARMQALPAWRMVCADDCLHLVL
jgi:hypothetical protein